MNDRLDTCTRGLDRALTTGAYVGTCPVLSRVVTEGEAVDETIEMAKDAVGGDLRSLREDGRAILQPRLRLGAFCVAIMALSAGEVSGQVYPYRPIRIVVPGTGGGTDFSARLLGQGISGLLGQQVIVENRPTGVIPGEIVSKAQPDGYTLLMSGSSLWLAPFLQNNVPFDPVKDFSPITLVTNTPTVLVVHPTVAAKSVKELIALAKASPKPLNYASGGAGSAPHLAAELFKIMAGVNIVRVNYKGAAPGLTALMSGEVQVMFVTVGSAAPHVKAGRLRALAITSAQPSELAPGLPTVAASGLPGYEAIAIYGLFAPSKTPVSIIKRLNQVCVRFLNTAEAKEKLFSTGAEPIGSSPERLAAVVKSDMAVSGKIIKDAGILGEY